MTERIERIKLAWALLWARDSGLVHHVRREIGRVDRDVELSCTNVARAFSLGGHSGGSASVVIPWLALALSWKPIAPLTGDDDEWNDVSQVSGYALWQNKRCGSVFKRWSDGEAYDLNGRVFRDPCGASYTSVDSRVPVTFPYTPRTEFVDMWTSTPSA